MRQLHPSTPPPTAVDGRDHCIDCQRYQLLPDHHHHRGQHNHHHHNHNHQHQQPQQQQQQMQQQQQHQTHRDISQDEDISVATNSIDRASTKPPRDCRDLPKALVKLDRATSQQKSNVVDHSSYKTIKKASSYDKSDNHYRCALSVNVSDADTNGANHNIIHETNFNISTRNRPIVDDRRTALIIDDIGEYHSRGRPHSCIEEGCFKKKTGFNQSNNNSNKANNSNQSTCPLSNVNKLTSSMTDNSTNKGSLTPEEMRLLAHEQCSEFLGGPWSEITANEMHFVPITGGLSNFLYLCALPSAGAKRGEQPTTCMPTPPIVQQDFDKNCCDLQSNGKRAHDYVDGRRVPARVLFRLYGVMAGDDKSQESVIFALLWKRKLGPKLYGVFQGGRLEEYLPAQPISERQMREPDISEAIARKMATVHYMEMPISKKNRLFTRLHEWAQFARINNTPEWIENNLRDKHPQAYITARELLQWNFEHEIEWMKSIIERCPSPSVFCHNDLLNNNILIHRASHRRRTLDQRLVFIDFEYCSYNYRGFDISNHMCEWAMTYASNSFQGFYDRFPSLEQQRRFVRAYLLKQRELAEQISSDDDDQQTTASSTSSCSSSSSATSSSEEEEQNSTIDYKRDNNGTSGDEYDEQTLDPSIEREVERIVNEEIPTYTQASHLMWGLWCIQLAHSATIDFDYWHMGKTRLSFYQMAKADYQRARGNFNAHV